MKIKFHCFNWLSFQENWFRATCQCSFLNCGFLFAEIPKMCHIFVVEMLKTTDFLSLDLKVNNNFLHITDENWKEE